MAVMWAVDEELGFAGLKSYVFQPGGTPFVVVLFDLEKGQLAAVIEADKLGQLRTGAASGVAAKYLAKSDARTLGVIGCGWQAESQVACIREALPGSKRSSPTAAPRRSSPRSAGSSTPSPGRATATRPSKT